MATESEIIAGKTKEVDANFASATVLASHRDISSWFLTNHRTGTGANPAAALNTHTYYNDVTLPHTYAGQVQNKRMIAAGESHVYGMLCQSVSAIHAELCDRIMETGRLDHQSIVAQTITHTALPARDDNQTADGLGYRAALEFFGASITASAGATNVTITYTNSAGVAGRTATITLQVASHMRCVFIEFPLEGGDVGVRSIQSCIFSKSFSATASTSSGFHIIIYKPIQSINVPANSMSMTDPLTGGFQIVQDQATLFYVFSNLPGVVTTPAVNIRLSFSHIPT